ncbi:MAG: hypothetical protein ACLSTO_07885 [Bilophila wadsworthia]
MTNEWVARRQVCIDSGPTRGGHGGRRAIAGEGVSPVERLENLDVLSRRSFSSMDDYFMRRTAARSH